MKYTPESLLDKFLEYIEYCKKNNRFVNIAGMCVYLDIDRETYYNYKERKEFFGTTKKIESTLEDCCLNANDHPSMKIFYLKNKFGYKDKQEVESINTNKNIDVDISSLTAEQQQELFKITDAKLFTEKLLEFKK